MARADHHYMRALARCSRRSIAAGIVLLTLTVGGFAAVVVHAQRGSRDALEERFKLRGALAARFIDSNLREFARTEVAMAQEKLAAKRISRGAFEDLVDELDLQAAVVLDRRGRLLHVYPRRNDLVGTNAAAAYPHLRAAVAGRIGVSDVVTPLAGGQPIVAVAVPFASAGGRRVFSGALGPQATPFEAFLRDAIPLSSGAARLVDSRGTVISSSGRFRRDDSIFVATAPVRTGGWSVELEAAKSQLYSPVSGATMWLPWLLLGGFALAGLALFYLVLRLLESRTTIANRSREITRLMRVQQNFVAAASHELRTPLTAVVGFLDLLRKGAAGRVTPAQDELLEAADRNAVRLVELASDLQVAAQLDAGRLDLHLEPLAVDELVKESAETALPTAREKRIEVEIKTDGPPTVLADRRRALQVVNNLVTNAVKYTPEDGRVEIRAYRRNGTAVIEVADNGIGIPRDEQDRLFDRFFRATPARVGDIPGTGLGLSIAKSIAELHGGSIGFTSEEGRGSTFRLELPLAGVPE
jgi:signal transduction histidine kinase